jgi:hypothetical protein
MRISQVPRSTPEGAEASSFPVGWLFAGGLMIILALGVLIVSRLMSRTETVPVLAVPVPVAVPDPTSVLDLPGPEPVPDPTQEPDVEAKATPLPAPSLEEESANASDEDPEVIDESPPEHLTVIVHPDNPVSTLSAEEVRRIYLEDRHFADGRPAKPVGRYRAPALRKVFLELVLGTTHQAIKAHWEAKKAEGLERVRRLPSDDAVVQLVSKRPDAVGYVDWAKLSPEARSQVKVVFEIRLQ